MENYFVMPDTKSFNSVETLAAYYGISVVELRSCKDVSETVKRACELIAAKRGYTMETLKMQELKRTMLILLAGNATIENGCSFEPRFDISNDSIVKAMEFIGINVQAEYSWDALSKFEADISSETMLIKVGLGVKLDYFEEIALDAFQVKANEKPNIDFLEEDDLYGEDNSSKSEMAEASNGLV